MSNASTGNIILNSLKSLILMILKVAALVIAWACKIAGLILTKLGEIIEKIITK